MIFSEVSRTFFTISQEQSRTKKTELLADLFTQMDADEAQMVSYLSLGTLYPPYKGNQFNIAEKSILKA